LFVCTCKKEGKADDESAEAELEDSIPKEECFSLHFSDTPNFKGDDTTNGLVK